MAAPPQEEGDGLALSELKSVCEAIRKLLPELVDLKQQLKRRHSNSSNHSSSSSSTPSSAASHDKHHQLTSQRRKALMLLCVLKASIRDTFLQADAWKTKVQEQKDRVEAHHLKLQNLLYEKDHLVREIRRCRGFSTKEMDKIEFEDGNQRISEEPEVHQQHLDQLQKELTTRKNMQVKLKQLREQIEQIEAAMLLKQNFLDGLRHDVQVIEEATKPLQEYMGIHVTDRLTLQHDASTQLATPLYNLFCELQAYQIASSAQDCMKLSIVEARELTSSNKNKKNKNRAAKGKKRSFPDKLARSSIEKELVGSGANGSEPLQKRMRIMSRSPSAAPLAEAPANASASANRAPSRSPSASRPRTPLVDSQHDSHNDHGATPGDKDRDEKDKDKSTATTHAVLTHTAEQLLKMRPQDDAKATPSSEDATSKDVATIEEEALHVGESGELVAQEDDVLEIWQPSNKALRLDLELTLDQIDTQKGSRDRPQRLQGALVFEYLPQLDIVVVKALKHPVSVLVNLFPNDSGVTLPRLAATYEIAPVAVLPKESEGGTDQDHAREVEHKAEELAFPKDTKFRPFYWAQWIAGLNPTKRSNSSSSAVPPITEADGTARPEASVRAVMTQLTKRFVSQWELNHQLTLLAKAPNCEIEQLVHPKATHLYPSAVQTRLDQWQPMDPPPKRDLFSCLPDGHQLVNQPWNREGCRFFRATFRNEKFKITAIVEITPEYPIRPPRFLFQAKVAAHPTNTASIPPLQEIEVEVNAYCHELIPHGTENFLLIHQLRKVQMCLDVMVNESQGNGWKSFGRHRRGKDRRLTMVYDQHTKELCHR